MSFYQHNLDSSINYSLPNEARMSSLASTKEQISQLEEKLSNYEMQYTKQNASLNEQIKQLLKNDSVMKRELEAKAKTMYQADQRFKESSAELCNLKAYLHQTETKNKELYQKYTEMSLEFKNASLSIQTLEEENGELKATVSQLDLELNMKIEECSDIKIRYQNIEKLLQETKASTELMSKESNTIKEMIDECQKENQRMAKEMKRLTQEIVDKDKEMTAMKCDNSQLDSDINQLQKINDALTKEHSDIEKRIEQLSSQLAKEKEINSKVNDSTKRKENEIINKNKTVEEMESHIIKRELELSNMISITNENIESICRWIENYFDGNFSNNDILPELQLISYIKNKSKQEPINFILLKEGLKSAKINYDKLMLGESKRSSELQKKVYDVERENAEKQKALQSIFNILQNEVGDYAQYSTNSSTICCDNNMRGQTHCFQKETLKSKIELLLGIVLQMKGQQINKGQREEESQGLDNEEKASLYIAQLKHDNEQLCFEISQLHSEINYLKTQMNTSSEMVYQINKLTEEKMSIEKRNKYLLNEIELKKAQIKSQEQMLSRRMNDETISKQIELDKDNLIKDNLMLISQNTQLKDQLRYYQTQS